MAISSVIKVAFLSKQLSSSKVVFPTPPVPPSKTPFLFMANPEA